MTQYFVRLETMDSVLDAGARQAKWIMKGGLVEEGPTAEQVHRSSWKYLARINEKGLITTNSQDAVDAHTGEVKDYERPYVVGLMQFEMAKLFVDRINLNRDDIVAMIADTLPKGQGNRPDGSWKSAQIAVTRRFNEETGEWFRSAQMSVHEPAEMIEAFTELFSLPRNVTWIPVQIFDTKWGRPARSKNGLYKAILKALNSESHHRRCGIWT